MQRYVVLRVVFAALLGVSIALFPVFPLVIKRLGTSNSFTADNGGLGVGELVFIRQAIEVNEEKHASESVIGNVPWYYLPLIAVLGITTGLGAYFMVKGRIEKDRLG